MPDRFHLTAGGQAEVGEDHPLPVTGTIASALPAGTNNIGDVDVASVAAGSNTIGNTRDAGDAFTPTRTNVSSADASGGAVDASAAPTLGQKIVVVDVLVSADTAMRVDFKIETAGTVIFSIFLPANGTVQFTPRGLLKLATADKKLQVQTSAAGNLRVMTLTRSE